MQQIELEDRLIYRASKGKKVKFKTQSEKYCEIVVKLNDKREIEEVNE